MFPRGQALSWHEERLSLRWTQTPCAQSQLWTKANPHGRVELTAQHRQGAGGGLGLRGGRAAVGPRCGVPVLLLLQVAGGAQPPRPQCAERASAFSLL